MMPFKRFFLHSPKSLDELFSMLAAKKNTSKIIAGGTDIMPNIKNGLYEIDQLISIKKIPELKKRLITDTSITLGALTSLQEIVHDQEIKKIMPALSYASAQVASPQIRNMGTIGGNICLDTRCLYFNQSEFWRSALGYCLKKDGCACHVIKTGKRCVAAASNDLATVLLAYNAKITIASAGGSNEQDLRNFYTADGIKNNILAHDQVVTSITINKNPRSFAGFFKLRHRLSIDFPLLSVAINGELDNKILLGGVVVINALVAKPKVIELNDFAGILFDDELVNNIASYAENVCHPQNNICDQSWRKSMISVAVKRAFLQAKQSADI